jgi:hypothetical protein
MIGLVLAVVVVAAIFFIVVLVNARRPRQSAISVARRLASAPTDFAALKRAADAVALLTADRLAAGRLGRFARATLAQPGSPGVRSGLEQQLRSVESGMAELERRADAFSEVGSCLAALAGSGSGSQEVAAASALQAGFAELAGLPGADIAPESLAGVVARLRTAYPPLTQMLSITNTQTPGKARIAKRLSAAIRPADPHAEAKAALLADMARLGLDTEWSGLPGWPDYDQLVTGYDATLANNARDFAQKVRAAREREAAALEAAIRPTLLSQSRLGKLDRLARELRAATEEYSSQLRAVLASAAEEAARQNVSPVENAALAQHLDALPALFGRCDEQLGHSEFAAAVTTLGAAELPAAPSWQPSREYQATWDRIADQLRDLADQQPSRTARAVGEAAADLQRRVGQLDADVESAISELGRQTDAAWTALASAAEVVKRNAARALRDPSTSHDAADPVRAAAAILCLDDVAARNLAQVIKHAIPEPRAATDSGNVDDQLSVTDQILDALDRNAAVLSGIDGVLVPLLSATGPGLGAGLAKGMAQLTPVPAELSQALHDVIGFAHHPLTGITPAGMIEGFIHYVEHSIVPGVGTLFAAGDDAPLDTLYLAKFLGKDVGSTYLHQAAKTPLLQNGQHQLDLAAHHVTHAAGLAAPDLVHGVVGHIPFVTLALSTTREIRLYCNDKTTLDQAIVNITVDTGGVFVGITGAELAVHLIAGAHPGGIITIPAGIAGSIIARTFTRKHRQRPYKEALENYTALTTAYSGKALELATEMSETARGAVGRERRAYLARVGSPTLAQQAAATELQTLTTRLRAATVTYSKTVLDLIEAGTNTSAGTAPNGHMASGSVPAVKAIGEVTVAAKQCDTQARQAQYAPALLTLTKPALPAPDLWRPGREYRELCRQTAMRISQLADRNRTDVARWANGATAEFRKRNEAIGAVVSAKAEAVQQECTSARHAIDAAAQIVQREADALGLKRKP